MKRLISLLVCIGMLSALFIPVYASERPQTPKADEYGLAHVNGIDMEYAVYGADNKQTMLLFPCNGNDMHNFDGTVLPYLAQSYKVITVSPRGCGKSERGDGELTFDVMAQDVNELLEQMNIDSVYIFGFSDGGNLGLVFTLTYPEKVEKLAIMGANINPFGTKPSNQIGIVFEYIFLRIKYFFTKDPAVRLEGDIEGLMVNQPTMKFKDLEKIDIPVLNIFGQSDMMLRTHSKRITKHIPRLQGNHGQGWRTQLLL